MNFVINRNLTDKIFTTAIKFDSFGFEKLTEEEEKNLINDFGPPILDIGAISYKGKFSVDADKRVVIDDANGDEVTIVMNSKKINLTEGFVTSLSLDSRKLPETELGDKINTKELLGEAKCLLYEESVKKEIIRLMTELRAKHTNFENPQNSLDFSA